MMTLWEVASELSQRLIQIFSKDAMGQRPLYGGSNLFQHDSHWQDLILFYEYFHGDNGAGIGASHQTGWTGLVAKDRGLNKTQRLKSRLQEQNLPTQVEILS
jgi:hypothetical protein